jgi:hypothetical protein
MARVKNSEMTSGAVVSSFSIDMELKPNLPVLAKRLNLASVSEMFAMLAANVDEAALALAPLAAKIGEQRSKAEATRKERAAQLAKLKDLSPEDLAKLIAQVEPSKG